MRLTREMHERINTVLAEVGDELELSKLLKRILEFHADNPRIVESAPGELFGREIETALRGNAP